MKRMSLTEATEMEGKNTTMLPENICVSTNIFRQHCLSLSVNSVRSSEPGKRVRNAFPTAAGFSLVEISLALLVVGIGMLAILGMFPAGLDQNARSISDTQAALFAGEVFSSLRVQAETDWNGIGQVDIPIAAQSKWDYPLNLITMTDNKIYTNIYCRSDNPAIVDHAFRYRLTLTTNASASGLIKEAALCFWPGEFGTEKNPAVFYSEFFKMNR